MVVCSSSSNLHLLSASHAHSILTHPSSTFLQDKLPSPSGPISITLLVPTNKAFLSMMWKNGLFIPVLDKVGDALPATVLYNAIVGAISPEQMRNYTKSNMGSAPSAYGLLGGVANSNLGYYAEQADEDTWFYYFQPGMNGGLAGAGTVIPVCNSFIYVTDEVLVPSSDEKLGGVQAVTIPDSLFGGPPAETPAPTPDPAATPAPTVVADPTVVVTDPTVTDPTATTAPTDPVCVIPTPGTTTPAPTPEPTPTPAPVVVPEPVAAVEPVACDTTLADAAKANGLTILSTALSQPSLGNQMPNAGLPTTFFAPVDTAFLSLLTVLNISITDALALGDKLAGVILYHIHPDEALTIAALSQRQSLTTELGFRMNDASQYTVGVASTASGVQVSGKRTGNVANVQKEFTLCGSTVLVIDQVLLPAETVETLPSPGPAATAAPAPVDTPAPVETPAPAATTAPVGGVTPVEPLSKSSVVDGQVKLEAADIPGLISGVTGILDGGVASGVGQFIDCMVNLTAAGTTLSTTTDANGRFSFANIPECALQDAVVTLPAGVDQLATCIDTATGLQPPFSLSALLSNFLGAFNGSAPSAASASDPFQLSPLTSMLSPLGLSGANTSAFDLSGLTSAMASVLGFDNQTEAAFGDLFDGLLSGDSDSLTSVLSNVQALVSQVIGGNVISELLPGIDINQAIDAINQIMSGNVEGFLGNLTDPSTIQNILQQAFNGLQGLLGSGGGSGDILGDIMDSFSSITGGRKMKQAPAPQQDVSAILAAVAQPLALLNKIAKDAAAEANLTAEEAAKVASRVARVAQLRLAPAAADLARGQLTISDFQTTYSTDNVVKAVKMEQVTVEPATVIAPTNTTSAAAALPKTSVVTLMVALLSVAVMGSMG